jgi:hypothetical protein
LAESLSHLLRYFDEYSCGKLHRVNGTKRVANVVLYDLDDTSITKSEQGLALRMPLPALRELQTISEHADNSLRQGLQILTCFRQSKSNQRL